MAATARPDRNRPAIDPAHHGPQRRPACPIVRPFQSNKHPSNWPETSQSTTEILHSFGSDVCLIKLTLILLPCVLKQR